MRNIITVLILFVISSCSTKPKIVSGVDYRITKIDSLENIYLIYVEKSNTSIRNSATVKIATIKTKKKCIRNQSLVVDKIYKLNLESLYPKNFVSHHYLGGITFNKVFIPFDKNYNVKKDLFITKNIEGLCYKN